MVWGQMQYLRNMQALDKDLKRADPVCREYTNLRNDALLHERAGMGVCIERMQQFKSVPQLIGTPEFPTAEEFVRARDDY